LSQKAIPCSLEIHFGVWNIAGRIFPFFDPFPSSSLLSYQKCGTTSGLYCDCRLEGCDGRKLTLSFTGFVFLLSSSRWTFASLLFFLSY
jgi:hypothetical protein